MPIKKRHQIVGFTSPPASGAQSDAINCQSATKGVLLVVAAAALDLQPQASPDGTTWYAYGSQLSIGGGGGNFAFAIDPLPEFLRIDNLGAGAVTTLSLDMLREIK